MNIMQVLNRTGRRITKYCVLFFITAVSLASCQTKPDIGGIENDNNNICEITCEPSQHGRIWCDENAKYGEKVTINVEADQCYCLDKLYVNEHEIDIENRQFIAMRSKYTIKATFVQNELLPGTIPFAYDVLFIGADEVKVKYSWESDLILSCTTIMNIGPNKDEHYPNNVIEGDKSKTLTFKYLPNDSDFYFVTNYALKNNNKKLFFKSETYKTKSIYDIKPTIDIIEITSTSVTFNFNREKCNYPMFDGNFILSQNGREIASSSYMTRFYNLEPSTKYQITCTYKMGIIDTQELIPQTVSTTFTTLSQ